MTNTTTKAPAVSADITGSVLTITSPEGHKIIVDAANLGDDIRHAAMMHGLKQKIVDAAAISRNPETGRSATITDKFDAMSEVATRLYAGEWNKRREAGTATGGGLLLQALMRLYAGRKTEEELRAYLDKLSDKEQAAIRASARVAPIIAAIKEERDAKKAKDVSADDLLAGLDESPL